MYSTGLDGRHATGQLPVPVEDYYVVPGTRVLYYSTGVVLPVVAVPTLVRSSD
jgi:hypothetical protein